MKKYCLLTLIILFFACACSKNASVGRILSQAERVMQDHPDSALKLIQTIDRRDISKDHSLAHYALCYSQALDKNCIDVRDDSLAHIAADYYLVHGPTHRKAQAFYYLSRVYENAGDEEKAVDAAMQADVLTREVEHEDPHLRMICCLMMGRRYNMQNSFDNALGYFKQAETLALKLNSLMNVGQSCQDQSWTYYIMDDHNAAKEYLRRGIEYYEKCGTSEELLADQKVWLKTLEIITSKTNSDAEKLQLLRNQLSGEKLSEKEYCWLAYYFDNTNQIDSMRYYVNKMLEVSEAPNHILWSYTNLANVEKLVGNYRAALECKEKCMLLSDSIYLAHQISAIQTTDKRLFAQQLQFDLKTLQSRHRYQTIIAGLVLVLSIVLLWQLVRATRQWKKRFERQRVEAEQHKNEISRQLTENYADLKEEYDLVLLKMKSVMSDEREARFIEALEMRLTGLKVMVDNAYTYKSKPSNLVKAFSNFATVNPSAKKEVWADLQYVVNKKYGGLVDYLRDTFPALNNHDLDLCCLLCFGFSPSGISYMYDYEDMGSLYNKRSRLRQKMRLPEEQKLEAFMEETGRVLLAERAAEELKFKSRARLSHTK